MENWTGFNLEDDTKLVVLEATSEGETGNGQTTCTLCQKGKNYDEVNFLEIDKTKPANELPILMTTSINSTNAFWNYKTKIKTIIALVLLFNLKYFIIYHYINTHRMQKHPMCVFY